MSVDLNQVHQNVEKEKSNEILKSGLDTLGNIALCVPDIVTPISQITENTVAGIGHAVSNVDPTAITDVVGGVAELGTHAVGAAVEVIGAIINGL